MILPRPWVPPGIRPSLAFVLLATGMTPLPAAGPDWMQTLPDGISISRITIPGTHNSAALHEPFPNTTACQSLTLARQLQAGVRFVDLRCRHQNDRFRIYHAPVDQQVSFADCLATLTRFLKANPSETIIVSIKEEHKPADVTRSFLATLETYLAADVWWLREDLPTLGQVRGKLILLRRFASSKALGISATDWKHHRHHTSKHLVIQDLYEPADPGAKWKAITGAFHLDEPGKLHLNFTSGYLKNRLGIPNIRAISGPIHQRLTPYLARAPHLPHGVVILDFATPDLTEAIFRLNFPNPSGAITE